MPCVLPPSWASLRIKIEQQFVKWPGAAEGHLGDILLLGAHHFPAPAWRRGLHGPIDGPAFVKIVSLKVPFEPPPVGLITLRGRRLTSTTQQLVQCVSKAAKEL